MTERSGDGGSDGVDAHAPTEISGDGTQTGPRSKRSSLSRPTLGRYRIDATLGSGGMGDVYRAHDSVLDRAVALKVLRSDPGREDDAQRRRRVVREARSAAALTHPNTVTIFDVGEDGDDVFIAMELLEGEDLRAKLDRGDATLEQKLRWLREAARALSAAHERGLVHRDVKPENMFVCKDGTLKLLDFGIAKREEDEPAPYGDHDRPADSIGPSSFKTAVGRRFGTPRYMAPEQHAGQPTDPRTDQYAWGLVAFELLTGTLAIDSLPTQTSDVDSTDGAALPPARFAELRAKVPELPEEIAKVIQRTLEPKKDERFASMSDVLEAIEAVSLPDSRKPVLAEAPLADAPAAAPPPRIRRRRWRWIVPLVAGLVAVTAGGVAVRRATRKPPVASCRAVRDRVVPTASSDRAGFDSTGKLLLARLVETKLSIRREGPDGAFVDVALPPFFEHLQGTYHDVAVFGIKVRNAPMTAVLAYQGDALGIESMAAFLMIFDGISTYSQRLHGPIGGVSITTFRDELVAVVAAPTTTKRVLGLPSGIDVHFPARAGTTFVGGVERGQPRLPSVDTSDDRIAVAYHDDGKLRFILLDRGAQTLGDNHEVASTPASPAVIFDGRVATVAWIDQAQGRPRMVARSIAIGQPAFGPPRVLVDEPASRFALPRMRNGRPALAWVSSKGAETLLRFAPFLPDGTLDVPATLATGADVKEVFVTVDGVEFAEVGWHDQGGALHVTSVSCAEPPR